MGNKGVQPLLDAIIDFMPSPREVADINGISEDGETKMIRKSSDEEPFSALAFKVTTDPFVGTLTFTRVYSGTVSAGTIVYNSVKGKTKRIERILLMHTEMRRPDGPSLRAGESSIRTCQVEGRHW